MITTIKLGSKGDDVKRLQKALNLTPDGTFGIKTEIALKEYQRSKKLTPDGIAGQATLRSLGLLNETITTDEGIHITYNPINKNIVRQDRAIKYIVIHYTAGGSSAKGNAMSNRNLFQNSNRPASADFCVDDETIVQVNPDPLKYYCYAVGDGKGKFGISNSNGISIEICSTLKKGCTPVAANHSGWYFTDKVITNAVQLTKKLMKDYNIPIERVVRHYDASGKLCPGIVGWNDGPLYNEKDGKPMNKNNSSYEWVKFKEMLK